MFDHIGITRRDLSISSQFSGAVLRPLGRQRCQGDETMADYRASEARALCPHRDSTTPSAHIALSPADRCFDDASYAAGEI